MTKRVLALALTVLAALLTPIALGTLPSASAATYEWTLSDVTFGDGGTMTGTILIDDAGTPLHAAFVTSGGSNPQLSAGHTYQGVPFPLIGGGWSVNATTGFDFYVRLFLNDLTNVATGGSVPFSTASYECDNCGSFRTVASGSLVKGALVDTSAPVITPAVDPQHPDGTFGWYTSNPTVSFTVADPDSPVTGQTGCGPQTVSSDVAAVTFTCQATSTGGTTSESVTVRRDTTPPTLAPKVTTTKPLLRGALAFTTNASDATSGILEAECDIVSPSATAGLQERVCYATDVAGNQTYRTVRYLVQYALKPLVVTGVRRVGRTVTVSTQVVDAKGRPINDAEAAGLGCRVKLVVTGAGKRTVCLKYVARTDRFVHTWKLTAKGRANLQVAATYPGSPTRTVGTPIGITVLKR